MFLPFATRPVPRLPIRVNGVAPGYVENDVPDALDAFPKYDRWIIDRTPLSRRAGPMFSSARVRDW